MIRSREGACADFTLKRFVAGVNADVTEKDEENVEDARSMRTREFTVSAHRNAKIVGDIDQ